MFAQAYRVVLTSTLFATLLLVGCSHEVEPTKAHDESKTMTQPTTTTPAALSLSDAALAVPVQPVESQPTSAFSSWQKFAGRYTGTMPCVSGSGSCVQGDMNVTLTLFTNGTALRTLSQQGQDDAMLERETAQWHIKRDGKTLIVVLPSHHQLSFELLPGHQLRFDHAELEGLPQDHSIMASVDPLLDTLDDDDMHERRYMLTMQ